MKYLTIVLLLFFSACQVETKTEYKINDEVAMLAVGSDATDSLLTEIAKDFKSQKGIEVDFSESKFDDNGKITHLDLIVRLSDGTKGGVESDFKTATTERPGFEVNYKSKDGMTFQTGLIH
jgi:hypothetical protein